MKKLVTTTIVVATCILLGACHKNPFVPGQMCQEPGATNIGSPLPCTFPPAPTIPLQVVASDPNPGNEASLDLGANWFIRYTIQCQNPNSYLVGYFVRDDGQVMTNGNFGGGQCIRTDVHTRGRGEPLLSDTMLYKFGKGHKVVVRLGVSDTLGGDVVYVADKELVTWWIRE